MTLILYATLTDLTEQQTLALVGKDVQYNFTIPGIANESSVNITWKWNGLGGSISEHGIQEFGKKLDKILTKRNVFQSAVRGSTIHTELISYSVNFFPIL